jgi:hypothetical protein
MGIEKAMAIHVVLAVRWHRHKPVMMVRRKDSDTKLQR